MKWQDVELPTRMQALPKDPRGLPIPFIVLRDRQGGSHFTINDSRKVVQCIVEDRCGICGQKNTRGKWWVGGPMSALHEHGWFIDTPLHFECMRYAVQVCPYLAAPKYAGRIDAATWKDGGVILQDNTMIPDRPEVFVAVMGVKAEINRKPHAVYTRPVRPIRRMEVWRHGKQLEEAEYTSMIADAMNVADVFVANGGQYQKGRT